MTVSVSRTTAARSGKEKFLLSFGTREELQALALVLRFGLEPDCVRAGQPLPLTAELVQGILKKIERAMGDV